MRDDYRLSEPLKKLEIDVEADVVETLEKMSAHTELTLAELANTAIRRFISQHKDFLPRN